MKIEFRIARRSYVHSYPLYDTDSISSILINNTQYEWVGCFRKLSDSYVIPAGSIIALSFTKKSNDDAPSEVAVPFRVVSAIHNIDSNQKSSEFRILYVLRCMYTEVKVVQS